MHAVSKIHARSLLASLAALSLVVTAGCATTQQLASGPQPQHMQTAQTITADQAYMAHVEQVARRRGVQVQWVNLPMRRVAQE